MASFEPTKESFESRILTDGDEHHFALLQRSAHETWSTYENEPPAAASLQTRSNYSLYCFLLNMVFLTGNIMLLIFSSGRYKCSEQACAQILSSFSPALAHISYESVTFSGFTASSPYKGYPNDQIDAMWDDLDLAGYVSISKKDLVGTLGKNETYATLDGTKGEEFLGSMEVFHQIHCLNLIRKFTYEDYYRQQDPVPFAFRDSPATLRKHVDHCIDYLRETIMCAGDLGVYMSFWVEDRDIPWPDFEVEHKCRSWESIVEYAKEAADGIQLTEKPNDAVVYKHPNHPES